MKLPNAPAVATIPACCTAADVIRILQISERQFYQLRRDGTFPIPEIDPPLDARPRFSGELVARYIAGDLRRHKKAS